MLGLPVASALVIDSVPGTGASDPYMHIFFELADGNYLAFFDAPSSAEPEWFDRKESFDMHVAMQVPTREDMLAMQSRIRSFGIKCAGPIDHEFVESVYMYDPNGVQIEITFRADRHNEILAHEKAKLPGALQEWTERTRDAKLAKFGKTMLDMRAAAPSKARAP